MTKKFDAIIIGTGQSGPFLANRLAKAGMQVAIIERHRFGGTCVNVGCVPTKTLVASAYAAYIACNAKDFGIEISGKPSVDMKAVKARKDAIVKASTEGVENWLKKMENCTVYEGQAAFESSNTVRVNGELLQADQIFINVGARASVPQVPGLDTIPYLTNSTMMEVDFLPEHLLIIGGGYIGLEFGQIYRRFGSKVTILGRGPNILSREDEDISQEVREILEGEGVSILTETEDLTIEKKGKKVEVHMQHQGKSHTVEGSHLLVATGRIPNTRDLGLEKAGIEVNAKGYIQVDDQLQTTRPGVWALGDCNGLGAFTHTSYNEFEIVAANLLEGKKRGVSDRVFAYNLYIDPPLGRAGMSEKEVRESGRKALVARMPMTRVGRAKEKGETRGFMKIFVDAESEQILGAALLGVGCDEVIHLIIDIMYAKAPYTVIRDAMHIHPTVSELIPTLLSELKPLT
ncbi:MAG: putative pyridine nucleotide-disulfide oxidoreductase RclA [Chlamydiae bacterium]|nr:putative pyridine nucleotide-disulfide oxidoreductase RclA [Chlamydiota bacterium]